MQSTTDSVNLRIAKTRPPTLTGLSPLVTKEKGKVEVRIDAASRMRVIDPGNNAGAVARDRLDHTIPMATMLAATLRLVRSQPRIEMGFLRGRNLL